MTTTNRRPEACRSCFDPLCFNPEYRTASGKFVPLNYSDKKPHKCGVSRPRPCNICDVIIYYDSRVLSRNEVQIPIEYETENFHQCKRSVRRTKPAAVEVAQ